MTHTPYNSRPITVALHRGVPVLLQPETRLRHLHIVGMTGSGKSSLLANMLAQDFALGHGVALIDPHGTLAEQALTLIPHRQEHAHRVVYLNASDTEFPVGFNLLDRVAPGRQATVAGNIVTAFVHIFGETAVGDRSQEVLRNALRALMENPSPSLLCVPRLLTDETYRARVARRVTDPVVAHYWHHQFAGYDKSFRTAATSPILNKLDHFLNNPVLRNIVAQTTSSFDMRRMMDEAGILIVNLAGLDQTSAYMLGALVAAHITQTALSRSDIPEPARLPFYFYADEFPGYAGASFKTTLNECRKFGLPTVLSHQLMAQLDEADKGLRSAIFGNAGSFIAFRVGVEDAPTVADRLSLQSDLDYTGAGIRETTPLQRLVELPNFTAWARLLQNGEPTPPMLLDMFLPPQPVNHRPHRVIALSRATFGRPRAKVEAGIRHFLEVL